MSLFVVGTALGARSPDGYGGCGNHGWMELYRAIKTAAIVDVRVVLASVEQFTAVSNRFDSFGRC